MMEWIKVLALACALLGGAGAARAQTTATTAAETSRIQDAAWLAGRWIGEGLGGQIEETWAPAAGGQMVGHFRLLRHGAPELYELMLIDVADSGLRLRVKHFNSDFVGWEEKDGWHAFEPVSAGPDRLVFNGLRLHRQGADELEIAIVIRYPDGEREQVLRLRRAPL